MSRPVCADVDCERSVVRYRAGAGYCLFHPDAQPPALDPKTGQPLKTTPPPVKVSKPKAEPPARKPYRAPGRVVERPPTKPTPVDVAAAYDDAAEHAALVDGPGDGLCPREGCTRPYRHRGWHTQPKPEKPPRAVRPPEQRPADGLCAVSDGCSRPWKHRGRHSHLDVAQVVQRYTAGESLAELAVAMRTGTKSLRAALTASGVAIRKRGEVVGIRGPAPKPIDAEECKQLYAGGMTARDIAEQLGVKARRVYDVLRGEGVLGPPGGREPGPGSLNAVRLKLSPEETAAVRGRASQLGTSMNAYLRGLVLVDLTAAVAPPEAADGPAEERQAS